MRTPLILCGWAATLAAAFFFGRFATPTMLKEVEVVREVAAADTPAMRARAEAAEARAHAVEASLAKLREVAAASGLLSNAPVAFAAVDARAVAQALSASSVVGIKDAVERARAFARLRDSMTPENAKGIMEFFLAKGFATSREQEEIRMLAESWAAVDGKSAVEFLNALSGDQRPEYTLRASLAQWAMKDLDAAEAWARSATTNQPNYYMIGIISGAANVDLSRAERLLYEMPYGRTRGDAMQYVLAAHIERGNADAMNWAISVPDPRLAQYAIRKVAAQVALTDPMQAANWVVKNSNEEQMQNNVAEIAKQWSYGAPVDAANWAFALPDGPARDAAVMATLPELARSQPALVEKMLLNMPISRTTDGARMQIARSYSEKDPVRALAWANTLSDKRAKDYMTQRVLDSWTKRDPQAAALFMQPK